MATMKRVINERTGATLATDVAIAGDPVSRGIGLLGRASVAAHEGLMIGGCSAVHTMFMRATIDLFFLDRDGVVVRAVAAVPPGRLSVSARGARSVLELGAAAIERDVRVGDRLVLT